MNSLFSPESSPSERRNGWSHRLNVINAAERFAEHSMMVEHGDLSQSDAQVVQLRPPANTEVVAGQAIAQVARYDQYEQTAERRQLDELRRIAQSEAQGAADYEIPA